MRSRLTPLLPVLLLAVLLALPSWGQQSFTGKVVGVHDGDTITVLAAGRGEKVRLHGIDAPELGQPFGAASKQALSRRVFGQVVRVEVLDTDRYGRLVGRVWLGTLDVNAALTAEGYAWAYREYSQQYAPQEAVAQERMVGLWGDRYPVPPWNWRSGRRSGTPSEPVGTAAPSSGPRPSVSNYYQPAAGGAPGRSGEAVQCAGTTRKGQRCGNRTKSANGRCHLHGG